MLVKVVSGVFVSNPDGSHGRLFDVVDRSRPGTGSCCVTVGDVIDIK